MISVKHVLIPLAIAVAAVLSTPLMASEDGKAKHDEKCAGCHIVKHDAAFYGREGRKATDKAELRTWVNNCQLNFGLHWWDEDVDAVTAYLNDTFYKYK